MIPCTRVYSKIPCEAVLVHHGPKMLYRVHDDHQWHYVLHRVFHRNRNKQFLRHKCLTICHGLHHNLHRKIWQIFLAHKVSTNMHNTKKLHHRRKYASLFLVLTFISCDHVHCFFSLLCPIAIWIGFFKNMSRGKFCRGYDQGGT